MRRPQLPLSSNGLVSVCDSSRLQNTAAAARERVRASHERSPARAQSRPLSAFRAKTREGKAAFGLHHLRNVVILVLLLSLRQKRIARQGRRTPMGVPMTNLLSGREREALHHYNGKAVKMELMCKLRFGESKSRESCRLIVLYPSP